MIKVLRGAILIDGRGGHPIDNAVVVIREDRIDSVGPAEDVAIPEGPEVQVLEARGKSILPGLIDSHVHVHISPYEAPHHTAEVSALQEARMKSEPPGLVLLRAVRNVQDSLRAGVTMVRDCGTRDDISLLLQKAIDKGIIVGPRVITSGPMITTTGGHCWDIGWEADTVDELRKAVREIIKSEADMIKVAGTGGRGTPGTNIYAAQYGVEELRAIVEDAHRLGRKVGAHLLGTPGIRNAVAAGVDILDHCGWDSESGVDYDEGLVQEIKRKDLVVCVTIPRDRRLAVGKPPENEEEEETIRIQNAYFEVLDRMLNAGVKMVIGSDSGCSIKRFENFYLSLEAMAKRTSLSESQVITMATKTAAEALGWGHRVGTVESGKCADLIIVEGNPLEDISVLRRVSLVLKGGEVVVQAGQVWY